MTTYQKLKAENLKLKKELIEISTRPDSTASLLIRSRWIMSKKIEDAYFLGSADFKSMRFEGLIDKLTS